MLSFLQPADAPVVPGLEAHEITFAKDQPEYNPLRALRSSLHYGQVLSRWTLTPSQRQAIAEGADVYLEVCTFNQPLQPIRLAVGQDVDPTTIAIEYGLPE